MQSAGPTQDSPLDRPKTVAFVSPEFPYPADNARKVVIAGFLRFLQESVGAIAEHDRENGTPYLETLSTYLQEGCRSQACADTMGLHVTTLRYRLSRIQELFGVDVETPEKRFAVELAIRLHGVIDNRVSAEK